jgi:probable H4MPT-linked C1 transfer pathway protein
MLVLGLDIGGANLKVATSAGNAHSEPFEIWRAPQELSARLHVLLERFPRAELVAVTMTAELADCYPTKSAGVQAIVAAVREAAGITPVVFWQTTGGFCTGDAAGAHRTLAAANWHALATWAGRLAPRGKALLFDMGSTTTDLIPLVDGRPVARGATDLERLLHHELIYTGVRRTPLCAVASSVSVQGRPCGVAAELFATMHDVYILLGLTAADDADCQTADGRPATIPYAHDRIARMVCCDRDEIDLSAARAIADDFRQAQWRQISAALDAVLARDDLSLETIILSGSGESIGRAILAEHPRTRAVPIVRLAESFTHALADAACAYAAAVLACENQQRQ